MNCSGFVLPFCLVACVQARTITVDPGSASSPPSYYKTITEAFAAAAADSTVDTIEIMKGPILKDGEWSHVLWDDLEGKTGSEPGRIVTSSTLQNVTIKGKVYPDHVVTINGNGTNGTDPSHNYGFFLDGSNITVENLKFTNCRWGGIHVLGDGNTVKDCQFDANHRQGLRVTGDHATIDTCAFSNTKLFSSNAAGCGVYGPNCTVTNCIASTNEQDGFRVSTSSASNTLFTNNCKAYGNYRQGLLAIDGANGLTIENCQFYNNDATGIQIENGCDDVVVKNSACYKNCFYTHYGLNGEAGIWVDCSENVLIENCACWENCSGIKITGATIPSKNVIVRYNRVYDNNAQWVNLPVATSFTNNAYPELAAISVKGSENIAIYHNTFYNNGRWANSYHGGSEYGGFIVSDVDGASNNISFINNILSKTIGEPTLAAQVRLHSELDIVEMDSNIYFDPPSTTQAYERDQFTSSNFSTYKTEMGWYSLEQSSDELNPLIDIVEKTFVPASNSPARNNAQWLGTITSTGSNSGGYFIVTNTPPWYFRTGDVLKFSDGSGAIVVSVQSSQIVVGQNVSSSLIGSPVVLAGWDYLGAKPDIGAVEYYE